MRLHLLAWLLYGSMALGALGLGRYWHIALSWRCAGVPCSPLLSALAGLALAALTVTLSRWAIRRGWLAELHAWFSTVLGPLRWIDCASLALASGIGEELLFRGVLQPRVGLLWASLIFGAVHVPPRRALWPWSVIAAVLGVALGAIFQVSGHLLGPILAHTLINFFNLHLVSRAPKGLTS
ncbi:MAG: CPBP family intramembrane metalloprotease [Deltaproteobacteria bacterium]|nr:CPBP family intramembrane metalloprotease [Deltaproteobacteria bacterium]